MKKPNGGSASEGDALLTVRDAAFNPEAVKGTWKASHEGSWVSAGAVRVECSRAPAFRIARVVKLQLRMPAAGRAGGVDGIGSGGAVVSSGSGSATHVALQLGLVAALGVTANAVAVVSVSGTSGTGAGAWLGGGAQVDVDVAAASEDDAWDVRGRASHPRFLELLSMEVAKHGVPPAATKGLALHVLGIDTAPGTDAGVLLARAAGGVFVGGAALARVVTASEERLWTAQAASNLVLPGQGGRGWLAWHPQDQYVCTRALTPSPANPTHRRLLCPLLPCHAGG